MWTPQLHVESRRNLWGRVKSLKTCPLLYQLSQHAPTPSTSLCFHFTRSLILKQCLTTASLALIFYKAISSHSGSLQFTKVNISHDLHSLSISFTASPYIPLPTATYTSILPLSCHVSRPLSHYTRMVMWSLSSS